MDFGQRILLLIPHPDDEVVAFCAAVKRAQEEGAVIHALYLTHGCVDRQTMWPWQRQLYQHKINQRHAEGEAAAKFLDMTPIGWSERPARHLWQNLSPVYEEIMAAIKAHAIDQVWLLAYEGGHPDHDGLNAVGQKLREQVSVLEFAAYNYSGGKTQAQTFPQPNGTEQNLVLTAEEQATKRKALALYASEQGNLTYVGHQQECFRPLARYDYTQPPHPGTLWYTRFQWVPIPHPAVNRVSPAAVSKYITQFLH